MSHVGWRLIVASMAKISRPREPAISDTASDFTLSRKASTSPALERASGRLSCSYPSPVLSDLSLAIFSCNSPASHLLRVIGQREVENLRFRDRDAVALEALAGLKVVEVTVHLASPIAERGGL